MYFIEMGILKKHTLSLSENIPIREYKKICVESDNDKYEVGIKGNKLLSLNPNFSCYDYQVKNTNKKPPPGKFTFILEWLEGKVRLNSNTRKIKIAEGRSGDAIKISKAKLILYQYRFE